MSGFEGRSLDGRGPKAALRRLPGRRLTAARGLASSVHFFSGRGLAGRALFAVAASAIGSSIYFSIGLVAGDALGLTPLVFLVAGAFFVITLMTYVEGASLHVERGGASMLGRYAFNELWSFIAGWAILLDYLIVMAIAAFSIPHYLAAFWSGAERPGVEVAIAAVAIAFVAFTNIRGVTADRLSFALRVVVLNLALGVVGTTVGLVLFFDPMMILSTVELGRWPTWSDLFFAAVIATIAFTGIEALSGLAGEITIGRRSLRRFVVLTTAVAILVFLGISLVALSAVPVRGGQTELGGRFVEAPVLGIVSAYEPAWLRDGLRYAVGGIAALALLQGANVNMLGLSRLAYSLATNRQIPTALGRLHPRYSTPWVVIAVAAVLAIGLVASSDIRFLAGIFAFGAMLAFTMAHVSVIVLRFREPDRRVAFRIPLSVRVGRGSVPLPALVGAVASFAAWVSVLVLHRGALLVGALWMLVGIASYAIYRRSHDESLTERYTVPPQVLQDAPRVEYGSILVPLLGGALDDDIVGTAGRLAAEEGDAGEAATIEALYLLQMPMSLPLDARVPEERVAAARRALARAKEVGEEYAGVNVHTAMIRSRSPGATIVEEARRRGVEAIVLAAEEPTRVRGGGIFGGRGGGPRDRFLGEMTQYVLEKAPCPVILTAPALEDDPRVQPAGGSRDGSGSAGRR